MIKDCGTNLRGGSYRVAKSFKTKNDYKRNLNRLPEESYISFVARDFSLQIEEMRPIRKKWFSDSGATAHMCDNRKLFENTRKSLDRTSVSVGDGNRFEVPRIGSKTSVVACNGIRRTAKSAGCTTRSTPNVQFHFSKPHS